MRNRALQIWSSSAPDAPKTAFNAHWRKNKAIYISVFQAMPQPEFGKQRIEYMRIITQAYVDNYIRHAQTPPVQHTAPSAGYGVKRELGSPVGDMPLSDSVKAEQSNMMQHPAMTNPPDIAGMQLEDVLQYAEAHADRSVQVRLFEPLWDKPSVQQRKVSTGHALMSQTYCIGCVIRVA